MNNNADSGAGNLQNMILNHPVGLFVLFFTEMWERFSYYGMRALLVLFLTASLMDEGWGWSRENALELYAIYTGLVYFTPMIGGIIADKLTGYRLAVVLGALIMALGHGAMALETPTFFYIGLTCLIIGNGLFKPNISSIVGQLYENNEEKKDAAYTIFYMGINAGAFLGILLCGYIGEKIAWNYGFGLAGIFMLLGLLQFWYSKAIFGEIGEKVDKQEQDADENAVSSPSFNELLPRIGTWLGIGAAIFGLLFYILPNDEWLSALILTTAISLVGYIMSDTSLTGIERDRLWVVVTFTFFTIFFWWAFEQAGGSMTIFANDYTNRNLVGNGAMIFNIVNSLITLGAMGVLTWVLLKLFGATFSKIPISNSILGFSFVLIWGIIIWMLYREFVAGKTEVPASWFSILNSFFIITFAPLISKLWERGIVKSGPIKFAIGLTLLGIGFGILAFGSASIPQGAKVASVSMIWLILAYLFHTLGELCVSPVGLSYVSKLAPVRLIGVMFGVWFVANFVANFSAGKTGSYIDQITETYSMSVFFLIFTVIPIAAGLAMWMLNKFLIKKMHGYE